MTIWLYKSLQLVKVDSPLLNPSNSKSLPEAVEFSNKAFFSLVCSNFQSFSRACDVDNILRYEIPFSASVEGSAFKEYLCRNKLWLYVIRGNRDAVPLLGRSHSTAGDLLGCRLTTLPIFESFSYLGGIPRANQYYLKGLYILSFLGKPWVSVD